MNPFYVFDGNYEGVPLDMVLNEEVQVLLFWKMSGKI